MEWVFIIIVGILAIKFWYISLLIIGAYLFYKWYKKDQEREQERIEQERITEQLKKEQRKQAEDECAAEVARRLQNINVTALADARSYIEQFPETSFIDTGVVRSFAIGEAKKRWEPIMNCYRKALGTRSYFEARDYIDFLSMLNSSYQYKNAFRQLDSLCSVINHRTAEPMSNQYGIPNESFIEKYGGIECSDIKDFIDSNCSFVDALWVLALAEPFNPFYFASWANEFPPENESKRPSVELLASLLYIKGKYGSPILELLDVSLLSMIRETITGNAQSETIVSLASVAAWSGDKEDEKVLLEALSKTKEWTGELSTRLFFLKNVSE